ncbi:MAG: VRR-NUC domain-containing protein [Gammaproteobacteria bacterium]|nr:VRR-NUC domain-containing protein [Gammaproteobacteria bacterium]
MTESELSKYTRVVLQNSGLLWWRVSNGPVKHGGVMKKSEIAGFPDFAGLTPDGQFWALELKTDKGRLSEKQAEWIKKIKDSCGIAEVAKSKDDVLNFVLLISGLKFDEQREEFYS